MNLPVGDGDTVSTSKRSVPEGKDEALLDNTPYKLFPVKQKLKERPSTKWAHSKMMSTELQNQRTRLSKRFHERHRRCGICHKSQEGPVCTPCGDVFCRQCILIHLEKQSATGDYTCPVCHHRFFTRPGVQPYLHDQHDDAFASSVLPNTMAEQGVDDPFHSFSVTHKASMKNRIEQFGEGVPKAASHTSHTICLVKETTLHSNFDIWRGSKFGQVQQGISEFSCNYIFTSQTSRAQTPLWPPERFIRTVITQGPAGIGKTSSVHKFILDWADCRSNQHVNFVFMFPFWKLNLVKDNSCSLHELLLNFHPELTRLADLKTFDDAQIVVIFDGLDESHLPLDFQNNQMLCDISERASVDTLVTNIIKGNLLPFAKVWMTSDASTINQIPSWYINRVTELLPLSDSQMEGCVKESVNNVREARKIIKQIQKSRSLNAMCHIPALCSIAVSLVKNMLEQGECRMIQTCTELYLHFLVSQMNEDETKSSSVHAGTTRREMMLRFAELAFRHLMKNNFTFSEQDLKECGIDVSDPASFFRICTEINQERSEFFKEKVYCFTHVGIQEFLSALCVFYAYNSKNMEILHHLLKGKSAIQPEDVSLDILLRSAVDKVLVWKNRHQYFLRFLLGMSLESNQMLLQGLLKDTCSRSATTESTLKYIKSLGGLAYVSVERYINLLYCQIELQDPSMTEDIEDIGSLLRSQRNMEESCFTQISTIIKVSGIILDEFNFKDIHHSLRHSALPMIVSSWRKVQLSYCDLTEDSCKVVASVLQQPHCALRELDMSQNYLRDSGVHLLCSGLKSPNCKLEILRLSCCGLSQNSCALVASVLQQPHCALRELDMSQNDLMDSGVHLLCSGLKSPNCKLEILRLSCCGLTEDSCKIVASVLQQPHCALRALDMSRNSLMDLGVNLLCSGLKSPNCKLEILRLSCCSLTGYSCKVVVSVLQQPHCALSELDMSRNSLMDSGVHLLCSGLKSPNCKLEILRLSGCYLTMQSCYILNSFLDSEHSCLRELDVSYNLEGLGVNLLTERLNDPKCKLETLNHRRRIFEPSGERARKEKIFRKHFRELVLDYSSDDPETCEAPGSSGEAPQHSPMMPERKHFRELVLDYSGDDPETCEAPGSSGEAPQHSPMMPESKVEDLCSAEARECNGDVNVFTPESAVSEKITYRFRCSSAGVHQCRYTGLIFKTDTAAEVQYQTVSWDYRKLEHEGLVAVGPLFKMKGLHGAVSQLGFPHCEIFSSDETPSLTVIHITDSKFEMLETLRTSDSHVFLNITGFCKFGLANKRRREDDNQCQMKALVMLFLNVHYSTLNVLLLPRNVIRDEVCENWRKIQEQRADIYVATTPLCSLFQNEKYSLTCSSSHEHKISPKTGAFDGYGNGEDYYSTFQVFLSNIEPIDLYLHERDNECVWESYVNLPAYFNGNTPAESRLSSPYTPPGQDFFHKHKGELESRLGLLRPILSELVKCGVLNPSEREEVESEDSGSKQNRSLLLMLEKKGGHAQEEFYRVLVKSDRFLVKGLERPHEYRTSA